MGEYHRISSRDFLNHSLGAVGFLGRNYEITRFPSEKVNKDRSKVVGGNLGAGFRTEYNDTSRMIPIIKRTFYGAGARSARVLASYLGLEAHGVPDPVTGFNVQNVSRSPSFLCSFGGWRWFGNMLWVIPLLFTGTMGNKKGSGFVL